MKLSEFLTVYSVARLQGLGYKDFDTISVAYKDNFFLIPKIYCKDGFNVSIQVHYGAYCASENGTREFGLDWQKVEWGYPSEPLTNKKYNPEDEYGISVGGYVPIEVMEELIEQHGGINIMETLVMYLSHE